MIADCKFPERDIFYSAQIKEIMFVSFSYMCISGDVLSIFSHFSSNYWWNRNCSPFRGTQMVFSGVHVALSLVFYLLFCRSIFVLFRLAIVLSDLLRFTASDYLFGIVKLFLPLFLTRR
jgi:hypothetical protein